VVPGSGTATHYDSTGGGNCSHPALPADRLDVALSHVEYGTADACGGYLDVVGPEGTVRVAITNQCPECQVGHIDLSRTAFARIAPLEAGQVPVTYSLVRNPPLAESIALRVKDGSSRWWMQIQALDHGNPLAAVDLRTGDGWRALVPTEHNYWTAEDPGPGDGPFTVRLTDIHGQSVTVDGIALTPGAVQRTGARLYGAGGGAPPAAPATTAAPTTLAPTSLPPTTTTAVPAPRPAVTLPGRAGGDEVQAAAARADGGGLGAGPVVLSVGSLVVLAGGALVLRRRLARRPADDPGR
jgi:expansin (peptidoglycan-binding protein)